MAENPDGCFPLAWTNIITVNQCMTYKAFRSVVGSCRDDPQNAVMWRKVAISMKLFEPLCIINCSNHLLTA